MTDAVIRVRGLRKRYPGSRRPAVDGVDLDVARGEVVALLGPNGAGKTTTVEVLEGHRDRDGGEVAVLGVDPGRAGRAWRARIGVVTQSATDLLEITPAEAVRHFARYYRDPRDPDEVLELVGLAAAADRRPGGFSLGMGQRLGLATALLGDPGTIILDEPGNGLDPQGVHWLRSLLRGFAAEGRTVLVSSHQLAEMEALADDLVVIGRGRLVARGSVSEFVRRSGRASLEEAFLAVTHEAEEFSA